MRETKVSRRTRTRAGKNLNKRLRDWGMVTSKPGVGGREKRDHSPEKFQPNERSRRLGKHDASRKREKKWTNGKGAILGDR